MDCSRVCRVGYALNPKKLRKSSVDKTLASSNPLPDSPVKKVVGEWRGGGLSDILDNLENDTVHFSIWDHEVPDHLQPEFDVIIHKLTEDIDRKESSDKMKALENYLRMHPNTAIVDPIDSVRKVISRSRTCQHLRAVETSMGRSCPFRQPKYVVFEGATGSLSSSDTLKLIAQHGLEFPIICKPVEACGTAISHHMVVIVSPEDIHLMVKPCVVQQYYNHDANFFKVYVIDKEVMVFQRTSLPNLSIAECSSSSSICSGGASCKRSLDTNGTSSSDVDGETKHRRLTLRSVGFDSRKHYPTIEDFLVSPPTQDALKSCGSSSGSTVVTEHQPQPQSVDANGEGVSWKTKKRSSSTNNSPVRVLTRSATARLAEEEQKTSDAVATAIATVEAPAEVPTEKHSTSEVNNSTEATVTEDRSHELIIEQFMDEFKAAAVALQKEFQLSLFGFDVIIPNTCSSSTSSNGVCESTTISSNGIVRYSSDDLLHVSDLELTSESVDQLRGHQDKPQQQQECQSKLVVIDVNYFPSYKEVKDFPFRLKSFLRSKSSIV